MNKGKVYFTSTVRSQKLSVDQSQRRTRYVIELTLPSVSSITYILEYIITVHVLTLV